MIFIVNGRPGVGKTTFEHIVKDIVGDEWCQIYSTIDPVKNIAKQCGWDGSKTQANRKFLSDLKDLLTKWNDVPIKYLKEQLKASKEYRSFYGINVDTDVIYFIDCREPEEIKRLCKELNARSVLIRRESVENEETSNHADEQVFNYDYDYVIENNGNLEALRDAVYAWLNDVSFQYYKHS